MSVDVEEGFDLLLGRARSGDAVALGVLLSSYHAYMRVVASSLLRTAAVGPADVSDVIQETNLKACANFPGFRGTDERELVAWLRQILANHVLNLIRRRRSAAGRPESLEALLERAGLEAHVALAAPGSSPSGHASRREQAVLTANALESLPPDYKQVLILRYLEKLPHEEVGRRMGRSDKASRMLLMRAAEQLERKLREQP